MRSSTNAMRMIGLAAMAGLGLHFNTPGDAAGGGGGGSTPAPATPAPAKPVAPLTTTTVEDDLGFDGLLGDDEGGDASDGGGEGGGEEEGGESGAEAAADDAGEAEGAAEGAEEGAAGDGEEGEGEATTEGEEGAAAAGGTDATAAADQGKDGDAGDAGKEAGAADPAVAAAAKQYAQRVAAFQGGYASLKAKIAETDPEKRFDPVTDGEEAVKLLLEGFELIDTRIAELGGTVHKQRETAAAEDFWTGWGKQNADVGAAKARAVWTEELAAARKKFPKASAETIDAVATERWESRINLIKAQAKSKAKPAGKPPVTAAGAAAARAKVAAGKGGAGGGGTVIPRAGGGGVGTRPPQAKPRSVDDKLEAGHYGNLASLV